MEKVYAKNSTVKTQLYNIIKDTSQNTSQKKPHIK